MAHTVSPYLLAPRRDLRTACRQIRLARGLPGASCGACDNVELCPVRLAEMRRKAAARNGFARAVSEASVASLAKLKRAG
jgi:hypothetical protein